MSNLKKALALLEAAGIDRVEVQFSGGGDSGQIDYVGYFRGDKDVLSEYVATRKSTYIDGKWECVDIPAAKDLGVIHAVDTRYTSDPTFDSASGTHVNVSQKDLTPDMVIEAYVYEQLDACGVDWYNNEGGQGKYTFTLEEGKWTYEFVVEVNYVEVMTEHMAEGNIDDEEGEE